MDCGVSHNDMGSVEQSVESDTQSVPPTLESGKHSVESVESGTVQNLLLDTEPLDSKAAEL